MLEATGFGLRQKEIARLVKNPNTDKPIDEGTLVKHFKDELQHGRTSAIFKVAKRLFDTAIYGEGREALSAQIFFLKARAGWSEKFEVKGEVKNATGVLVVPASMSMSEWAKKQEEENSSRECPIPEEQNRFANLN